MDDRFRADEALANLVLASRANPVLRRWVQDVEDEMRRLRAQAQQFHEDWGTVMMIVQYGNPPSGWTDPVRIEALHEELRAAEARHRSFDETDVWPFQR